MMFILLFSLLVASQCTEIVTTPIIISKPISIHKHVAPFDNEPITKRPSQKEFSNIAALSRYTKQDNAAWEKFLKEIALTVSLGCSVGALSSSVCQTLEARTNIHWIGCWILSHIMRSTILYSIMPSLKENHIPHNINAIAALAWATDWIVYIYKKNFLASLLN